MGQLGDLSPQGSVIVGVFVGLVSTSIQSLGLTLQRKSHILEDEKDSNDTRRPPHRRRRWQLGMFIFIISNIFGSTIQITTLPLPVLSTLQASGLVFNSICATLILGEPFTQWSFGGTILVCGGAVLIAIFGAIGESAHNLDELLELLGRRQFVLWMIGQVILVMAIVIGVNALKFMNPWTINSPRMRLFRGMAYGSISGILSAHSLLVAKSAVELLVRTIVDRHNEFNRWQSWMILLGLVGLALSQLYYLHRGLKLCSTSILYPFVFCVYNIIAILDGLIYFHQGSRLSSLHALLIALGTLILLTGVFCLSWRLNNDPATRSSVAQTPLTPGMGFVDDDSESSIEDSTAPSETDEEATNAEDSPFLGRSSSKRKRTITDPCTPTAKDNDLLSITRMQRKGITESEEIWEELGDDSVSEPSRFAHQRANTISIPAKNYPHPELEGSPTESTSLLTRSGMGRIYRDRRRRSAPMMGSSSQKRSRASRSQDALGGWWKMQKWWKGWEQKGKYAADVNKTTQGIGGGDRGGTS